MRLKSFSPSHQSQVLSHTHTHTQALTNLHPVPSHAGGGGTLLLPEALALDAQDASHPWFRGFH